jgi:bifunctional DNase/RNase
VEPNHLIAKLVAGGHTLRVNQRPDGTFVVWRGHPNPKLAATARKTENRSLDAALQEHLRPQRPLMHPWMRELVEVGDE